MRRDRGGRVAWALHRKRFQNQPKCASGKSHAPRSGAWRGTAMSASSLTLRCAVGDRRRGPGHPSVRQSAQISRLVYLSTVPLQPSMHNPTQLHRCNARLLVFLTQQKERDVVAISLRVDATHLHTRPRAHRQGVRRNYHGASRSCSAVSARTNVTSTWIASGGVGPMPPAMQGPKRKNPSARAIPAPSGKPYPRPSARMQ